MMKIIFALLGLLWCASPGYAQNSSAGMTPCGNGLSLNATSTTSNVLLSTCGTTAVIWNTGTVDVFFNWGTVSNTAAVAATSWPLPAGSAMTLSTGRAPLYIAAITGSGSSTVRITQGQGDAALSSGGLGSSGTVPVTVAQTGFDVSVIPTIQNASYVSGNCMGGFQTVALGTTGSALSAVSIASQGGLATAKQIYIFSANPTGSTCTDKSTFTIATADLSKLIYTGSITPVAPTGTTKTFGQVANLGLGIPSGGTIYAAIVETATETPATSTDLVFNFSGL